MKTRGHHRNQAGFWGILFILLGILFLLETVGVFDIGDFIETFWPAVLIIAGLWLILRRKDDVIGPSDQSQQAFIGDRDESLQSNTVTMSNIFGDVKITITSKDFQGGHIGTVFGDVTVDLSAVDIISGEKELTIHTVFGDIRIDPPRHVAHAVQASAVIGDINIGEKQQSGFFPRLDFTSQGFEQAQKRLRIFASHVFGDIKT